MTVPVINFGNGLRLDLSEEPWKSQGCRWAIAAISGGGKSTLARVTIEELHAIGQPFLVIDPKTRGEYRGLIQLDGVLMAGETGHINIDYVRGFWIDQVIDYLHRGAGIVCHLGFLSTDEIRTAYTMLIQQLYRRQAKLNPLVPCFVIIDEADIFAPQKRQQDVPALLATIELARRGRDLGLNMIALTQRPGDMEKDALSQFNMRLIGYLQNSRDFEAVESELNVQAPNKKRLPPPPRGMGTQPLRVTERVKHSDILSLTPGQFYAAYGGKVLKLGRCRQPWTPDLATTPRIEVRQRPLFEMDNGKPAPALIALPKRAGGAAYEE